jgi:hypothetical protein
MVKLPLTPPARVKLTLHRPLRLAVVAAATPTQVVVVGVDAAMEPLDVDATLILTVYSLLLLVPT